MERQRVDRRVVYVLGVLAGIAAAFLGKERVRGQAPRGRENIVGVWQAPLGSFELRADGTYVGFVTEYTTGRRHVFRGRYTYATRALTLGGERAYVQWHSPDRITITVVASFARDFPRWQVTYTRKR